MEEHVLGLSGVGGVVAQELQGGRQSIAEWIGLDILRTSVSRGPVLLPPDTGAERTGLGDHYPEPEELSIAFSSVISLASVTGSFTSATNSMVFKAFCRSSSDKASHLAAS